MSFSSDDIISTSHHIVSIKDSKVYKQPRDKTPEAIAEIQQDYLYLTFMGYEVELSEYTLIMPFIGEPLKSIAIDMEQVLTAITTAQKSLPLPPQKKKLGREIYDVTHQKIKERLKDNDYNLKARTKKSAKMAKKILNKRTPTAISHTDTHSKNFLKDAEGRIHLIDWESSIAGIPEFDLATLYVYLQAEKDDGLITEDPFKSAYMAYIEPQIEDREAFDAFYVFKLIRHLSWAYLEKDKDRCERLVVQINDIMRPYIERDHKNRSQEHK